MFNFMLKHKKGFTLVELMTVMVLMGFGVVALANLFQSAYRTFNQTEERYIKQEMVKTVAEYLQSSISIGAATKAEIYPDSSVVPTSGVSNNPYHYVYIEKSENLDGYYLYTLESGKNKDDAVCINPDIPIYVTFSAHREKDYYGADTESNQCGIKVRIAAVDNDYRYLDDDTLAGLAGQGKTASQYEAEQIEDYIFYDTVVSYHFPNMVAKMDEIRVNFADGIRDKANVYNASGGIVDVIDSVDENGKVLRISSNTALVADNANPTVSVSGMCFIATAGFGEATGEVGILCDFRDNVLKTNPLGRMFVKAYYAVSPPIADFIAESEPLKAITRTALKPLVAIAVYALEPELLVDQIPYIIMGVGSLGGIVAVAVYRKKKRLA